MQPTIIAKKTKLTPALQAWLMQGGDAGRFLYAEQIGDDLEISARARMGAFLVPISESEARHATALLAADSAEPLNMPSPDALADLLRAGDDAAAREAQEKVDFAMFEVPTRDPEDRAAIRKWREERRRAAFHAFKSAQAEGCTEEDCKNIAARAAAMVPRPSPVDTWRDES